MGEKATEVVCRLGRENSGSQDIWYSSGKSSGSQVGVMTFVEVEVISR